ncbi:MAG: AmmeMemoRadiSam system protein B [Alphaproteobacteria bacterium]
MNQMRKPAVAGSFYPAAPDALRAAVADFLKGADTPDAPAPKAIIAPHAGYIYSGAVAASAYVRIAARASAIRRVVLLGPAHRVGFRGIALPGVDAFETPLGSIPLDLDAIALIEPLPQIVTRADAHAQEHSIEVHLPFLQQLLGAFSLVPLVVGDAEPAEIEQVIELLWGAEETLIVVSSDLSHFQDYATAQNMDRATSAAIEAMTPDEIGYDDACGRLPIAGLLRAASKHGLHAKTIDLRNSGDTAGPRDNVVGYGAYVIG